MASAATISLRQPFRPRTDVDDPVRSAFIDEILRRRVGPRPEPEPKPAPKPEPAAPQPKARPKAYYGCRQRTWHPTPEEEIEICLQLWHRRQTGQIPRLWIDPHGIRIEVQESPAPLIAPGTVRRISWRQAQRIADGEDWREVAG